MLDRKKNNGITLIALVITIIILLIIAGVSINAVFGENGLITRANEATIYTNISVIEEQISLKFLNYSITTSQTEEEAFPILTELFLMELEISPSISELAEEELPDNMMRMTFVVDAQNFNIKSSYNTYKEEASNGNSSISLFDLRDVYFADMLITITDDIIELELIKVYYIDKNGKIYPDLQIESIVFDVGEPTFKEPEPPKIEGSIKDLTPDNVPIPNGFYYVGGTKEQGAVISDRSEDEGKGADHNTSKTLVGNQFVFVPYLGTTTVSIDISYFGGADENMIQYVIPILANSYDFLKDTISSLPEGSHINTDQKFFEFLIQNYPEFLDTAQEVNQREHTFDMDFVLSGEYYLFAISTTGRVRKARVKVDETRYSYLSTSSSMSVSFSTEEIKQLEKYGGFYIARYEAGTTISTATNSARDVSGVPTSKSNQIPWNYISKTNAVANGKKMYDNEFVKSTIMTNSKYYILMCWLEQQGYPMEGSELKNYGNLKDSTIAGITESSTDDITVYSPYFGQNWSNTSRTKSSGSTVLLKTGNTSHSMIKNIYDIVGNLHEYMVDGPIIIYGQGYGGCANCSTNSTCYSSSPLTMFVFDATRKNNIGGTNNSNFLTSGFRCTLLLQ